MAGLMGGAALATWEGLMAQIAERGAALDRFGHQPAVVAQIEAEIEALRRQAIAASGISRIELQDVPNDFVGGIAMAVGADGAGWARRVERGGFADERQISLPLATLVELIQLLHSVDFPAIAGPGRMGIPDEARPAIHVIPADGPPIVRWKWAGERNPPFDLAYRRLTALAEGLLT